MRRYEMAIRFRSGTRVTVSHDLLFVEVDAKNDFWSGYITEEDMAMGRERLVAGRNTTSVRIGIKGESRLLMQVDDAVVDYHIPRSHEGRSVVVTKGVVTGGSIPFAFGMDFDEIVFSESHEKGAP